MKYVIAILAAVALCAGCASNTPKQADARALMQADVIDQAKAAAATPLFKLTCPTTGCVIASLEVGNPAAAAQMAEVVKVAMTPQPSVGLQAFVATLDAVKSLGAIGLVAHGVTSLMSSVVNGQVATSSAGFSAVSSTASAGFASNTAIAHMIPQPGAVTTNTYTLSGGGVIGGGSNTTTTTTNTNTNSGNRTCAGAAGGNGAGTTTGGAGGVGGSGTC